MLVQIVRMNAEKKQSIGYNQYLNTPFIYEADEPTSFEIFYQLERVSDSDQTPIAPTMFRTDDDFLLDKSMCEERCEIETLLFSSVEEEWKKATLELASEKDDFALEYACIVELFDMLMEDDVTNFSFQRVTTYWDDGEWNQQYILLYGTTPLGNRVGLIGYLYHNV